MIRKFIEVVPNQLYRGSAPTAKDVLFLKEKYGINKIISLDQESADKITRACKLLNIQHIVLPINFDTVRPDLLKLLKHDLKKLLLDNGPTFVHCLAGKDRTGLLIALFKCKYMNMDPEEAIEEAESLGFGVGIDPKIVLLFKKLIYSCKPSKSDLLEPDIVSMQRQYISDNRDTFLDEGRQGSFAPYLSPTRQYPIDALYSYINDQSPTRENYNRPVQQTTHENIIPLVGVFNNDAGARGFGPTENYSGFFYD